MSQTFGAARVVRDVGHSLQAAVAYVRRLPELWTTVLFGGLLWGYSLWLVLPGFLVMGYLLRVLRHVPPVTDQPDVTPLPDAPPKFDRWGSLLVDGVRAYIVWTAYLFFAFAGSLSFVDRETSESLFFMLLDLLLGNVSFLLTLRAAIAPDAVQTSGVTPPEFALALLLFGISMYVAPAALLNVAARGHLSDGFAFDQLRPILRSPTYARRWSAFFALWFLSSILFFAPSGALAALVVPPGPTVVFESVRESIELLRGFLSFLLLVVAYATLGGVSVPPVDEFSLRTTLSAFIERPIGRTVGRTGPRFGVVLATLCLLSSFWSLPAVVLFVGYLARYVRAASAGTSPPGFERPPGLIADGVRGVVLWVTYAVVPLTLALLWYAERRPGSNLLTATTGFLGTPVGAWYLARDFFNLLSQTVGGLSLGLSGDVLLAGFVVTTLVAAYLFPAAMVRVATEGRLRSGYLLGELGSTVTRVTYLRAWLSAFVLFVAAEALSLSWNWWDMGRPGDHTETLFSLGQVPLLAVPTNLGLVSSAYLLVVSSLGVLLVLRAYDGIADAVGRRRDDREDQL